MIAYFVRRVLAGLFLILSLGLATYVVFYTIPTNPACEVVDCGPGNHTTPEQLKAAEHEIGVDKPVLEQYGLVLWRIVDRGSLGHSFVGDESVNGVIERTLPVTASLVLGGAVLLLLLSVPLAIVAARASALADRPRAARRRADRHRRAPVRARDRVPEPVRTPSRRRALAGLLHALLLVGLQRAGRLGLPPLPAVDHLRALLPAACTCG